jgi:hypothetical protein
MQPIYLLLFVSANELTQICVKIQINATRYSVPVPLVAHSSKVTILRPQKGFPRTVGMLPLDDSHCLPTVIFQFSSPCAGTRDSSGGRVTKLRAELLDIFLSIPGRSTRFTSSPTCPDRFWDLQTLVFNKDE